MVVVASVYSNEIDSFLLAPLIYKTILFLLVYEKTIVLRFSGIYLIPTPRVCIIKGIVFFFSNLVKICWIVLVMLFPVYFKG